MADGYEGYYERYYKANKARMNARSSAYRESHRDELKAYQRQYYQEHKEECKAKCHAYYEKNKEAVLAQCKVYYARKQAKKKEWSDNYQRKHAAELHEKRKAWKEAHPEKVKAWVESHRGYLAEKERERRRWKKIAKQTASLPMEEPT